MKEWRKSFFVILLLILLMAVIFALPSFAEVSDELKEIFLTREEWNEWYYVDCGYTIEEGSTVGMSQYLNDIAAMNKQSIQIDMDVEMSIRDIPRESNHPTLAPSTAP